MREARELELKYLRDLGVYEKVDEKEAVEECGTTPVDTKWVDTDNAFEEEPMQIRSQMCAREFKSDDRPYLYARTPPLEALKAIISIAANHKEMLSIMHIDVSRAYFHAREDIMGTDAGKVGLMKKSMYGTRDAASNWERNWQENVKTWGIPTLAQLEELHTVTISCSQGRQRSWWSSRGNDKCLSHQSEDHQLCFAEEHQDVEQEVALEKTRNCLSA